MIKIDDKFHIEADNTCCTLVLVESKTRFDEKLGKDVDYVTTDQWHFLNVEQCLNRYLDLCLNPAKSVADVLEAIKAARLSIKSAVKNLN